MRQKEINLTFQYDRVIASNNFCNRKSEIKSLDKMIERNQRIILYAPRRYGKSSIVNLLANRFLQKSKKALVVSIDLMDARSLSSIVDRMRMAISETISQRLAIKGFMDSILGYFKNASLSIDFDPLTGSPSVSLKGGLRNNTSSLHECFSVIKNLAATRPLLLVIDEFQDIYHIPEAQALMRSEMQKLGDIPIVILGSRRGLLNEMFTVATSPFFSFGDEMILGQITVEDWLPYFNVRLARENKSISPEAMALLCEISCHIPNAICEIGFALQNDENILGHIDIPKLNSGIYALLKVKEQSLRHQLIHLSASERSVVTEIAHRKFVAKLGAKDFLNRVSPSLSNVQKIVKQLMDEGFIEWEPEKGYRISDPIIGLFLTKYPL